MSGYQYRPTPTRARHAEAFLAERGLSDQENVPLPTEDTMTTIKPPDRKRHLTENCATFSDAVTVLEVGAGATAAEAVDLRNLHAAEKAQLLNDIHVLTTRLDTLDSSEAVETLAASMFNRRYAALELDWSTCPENAIKRWWRNEARTIIATLLKEARR
ncbi:hypothetical protein [Brevibacterium casei]|uniref:hypothetical protein n=1 Tax=Brevibacterium casei TaxID=33889 RepID=UPI00241CDE8B|nr:hypothetical protein [Brevibacterium casei]